MDGFQRALKLCWAERCWLGGKVYRMQATDFTHTIKRFKIPQLVEFTEHRAKQLGILLSLILLLIMIAMPHFGQAYQAMSGWGDQNYYLRIMNDVDAGNIKKALQYNYMGPSYIAIITLIKRTLAVDNTSAFVITNRSAVFLAILAPFVVFAREQSRFVNADATLLYPGFVLCLLFLFGTVFIYASTIPWSHFIFGFFGTLLLLIIWQAKGEWRHFWWGIGLGLCATIRLFDTYVIVSALTLYAVFPYITLQKRFSIFAIGQKEGPILLRLALGAVVGYTLHSLVLGHFHIYHQYGGAMSHEAFHGSVNTLHDLPVKVVQFLFDPCYYSLCQYEDFSRATMFLVQSLSLSNWRMPFYIQLPFYFTTLVLLAAYLILYPKLIRRVLSDPLLIVCAIVSIGAPLAYFTYIMGGSSQLKYGFMREMFFPTLCLLVAALRLLTLSEVPAHSKYAFVGINAFVTILVLQVLTYWTGVPRLESTHVAKVQAEEICQGNQCRIRLHYFNKKGKELSIPFDRLAMVAMSCGDEKPTTKIVELATFRYDKNACPHKRKIVALSTTTGSARLAALRGIGGVITFP